jgi:hypothetical protein
MKITATQEQFNSILAALYACHVRPYGDESGDPTRNAQRNTSGRTHYYDADTLKYHHSRVRSSSHEVSGLLFCAVCSDSLDMHNTKRGFRYVVHDVFGTCISRQGLDGVFSTSKACRKAMESLEIDLLTHYRQAIASQFKYAAEKAAEFETALNLIS